MKIGGLGGSISLINLWMICVAPVEPAIAITAGVLSTNGPRSVSSSLRLFSVSCVLPSSASGLFTDFFALRLVLDVVTLSVMLSGTLLLFALRA